MRPCKLPAREQCVQAIRLTTLTRLMLPMLLLTSAILGACGILIGVFSRSSIIGLQSRHIPVQQQQTEIPKLHQIILGVQSVTFFKSGCVGDCFKDVHAHCYCASFVRTLFIDHARATSWFQARAPSRKLNKILLELMTFALTLCANFFVGCSVTPTFFFGRSLLFLILSIVLKNKKICTWEILIISHILFK